MGLPGELLIYVHSASSIMLGFVLAFEFSIFHCVKSKCKWVIYISRDRHADSRGCHAILG